MLRRRTGDVRGKGRSVDLLEAMDRRHAVRAYTKEPIDARTCDDLRALIGRLSAADGFGMRRVTDEPDAFGNTLLHYGMFRNVRNYVAIAADQTKDWERRCGYYGAQVLLRAAQLGLDTCWVALSFSKHQAARHAGFDAEDKVRFAIAVGHGVTHGRPSRSKTYGQVASAEGGIVVPTWFEHGVEAALLAPSALNQQRFTFRLEADGRTVAADPGIGPYTRTDLGIAQYFFEVGAGAHAPLVWR